MKTLVITGFHRSATSATAHYLSNAGLDMGTDLLPGNIGNVNGHYEDRSVVGLHDSQLAISGTSWQFHDECPLNPQKVFLESYISNRSRDNKVWGVKDPRASLFLPQWDSLLGSGGHYLFIARHWSSCIESLLYRHSRELAYNMGKLDAENVHSKFWLQPDLAAKMWLAYNRRLLCFTKLRREKVLLVTQRSLFEQAPILTDINDRFGFQLDLDVDCPYDPKLINDHACETIFESLSTSIKVQLDSVWQELLSLADHKTDNERPVIYPKVNLPNSYVKNYHFSLSELVKKINSSVPSPVNIETDYKIPKGITQSELLSWLKELPVTKKTDDELICEKLKTLYQIITQEYPFSISLLIELGRYYLKVELYENALNAFQRSVSIGKTPPYVYMLIGQCYQELNNNTLSLYFFDKAINENPRNPTFYKAKASHYVRCDQLVDAIECYKSAISVVGASPVLVLPYSQLLLNQGRVEEACHLLKSAEQSHKGVARSYAQALMRLDYQKGLSDYYDVVSEQLCGKNIWQWLVDSTSLLTSKMAEQDFIGRCYLHWSKLPNVDDSTVLELQISHSLTEG